ncbi:hypothetical protein WN55_06190 [Dufourea novaeangliae]|uniref:Uncharacterized protein n=1 Tax=Dufourea novaeangliae TaxID=178035 RepID=A0A154P253_DUFNO|nr:hypothetical protein WN55_06190 [Dufourea novaeangliae]
MTLQYEKSIEGTAALGLRKDARKRPKVRSQNEDSICPRIHTYERYTIIMDVTRKIQLQLVVNRNRAKVIGLTRLIEELCKSVEEP